MFSKKLLFGLLLAILFVTFQQTSSAKEPTSKSQKVSIDFTYTDSLLRIMLFEIKPEFKFSISSTAIASNWADVPKTNDLKLPFTLTPEDNEKSFVMAVENKSKKNKYFFAVPHTVDPPQASLGVLFECLCNHHVYKVPPEKIWYRVVRLKFDFKKQALISKTIKVTHSFVEIDEAKALKEYSVMLYDRSDDPGIHK